MAYEIEIDPMSVVVWPTCDKQNDETPEDCYIALVIYNDDGDLLKEPLIDVINESMGRFYFSPAAEFSALVKLRACVDDLISKRMAKMDIKHDKAPEVSPEG